MTISFDHDTFAQGAVLDHAIRTNHHVVFNHYATFEDHVNVDQHITPDADFAAHIKARRVAQGHTQCHQTAAFTHLIVTFQFTELLAVVGALYFHRVQRMFGGHDQTIVHRHCDHVGQVILALCIVVRQAAHPVR